MSDSNEIDDQEVEATQDAEAVAPGDPDGQATRELTAAERQKLAELDEALAKFEDQKRWSDVIKTVLAKADIVVDRAEKAELHRQAGTLYIERSSNQAEAIKAFEAVLELSPRDIAAITQLKELYEKRRDWEKLVHVMKVEAEMLDPSDRPIRYVEMADLATQRLRKPEICIELWEKVREFDPGHPGALEALSGLYEKAREWGKLAQVLERQADDETDTTKLKAQLQKLGMIFGDKVGDDAGAVRAFKRLLTLDPEDRRAQEQLKKRFVALKAWDELEEFYAMSEKWDELIRIFEREADDKATSPEDRIALLFRAAKLWEEKNQKPDRAARAYEKVLETDETNLRAAEALSPIYEAANDARKLAKVYEVRLLHLEEPDAKVALLRETGLLYEERLRAPETAFAKYLEAFATQPMQEVVREDVERLAGSVDGGWDRVVASYRSAIEGATDEDMSIELRMSLGGVLRRIEKTEDAIAQYRAVYEARGDHGAAIEALTELYRQTGKFGDLLEIYDRRMELETDTDARRTLAYGKASLMEQELGDPDQAIEGYQAILEAYGDGEVEAFRALDRLYEGQKRWQDLASVLRRRIDLGPDSDEELAALKFRLGRLMEDHLGDKEAAVELHREVLILLPEHDGSRESLEQLLVDQDVSVTAARILEPIYETQEKWEHLVRALRVLHRGAETSADRLEILTKIGNVYAARIEDHDKAFGAFCEALREDPASAVTLQRLEMQAVEHERFPQLVELASELAGSVDDPALSRQLWMKAAEYHVTQLAQIDGAVAAYLKCLAIDPGDLEVLTALEALYRRAERWSDLVTVLRRRVEQSSDPAEQEEFLAQMAAIQAEFLQNPTAAIGNYKEILEIDPASARALSALDDLFEQQEMWSELADNVDRQLVLAEDPDRQILLLLRLANLREKRMNAVEAAIEIYRDILQRDSSNEAAIASLERLMQVDAHQVVIAEILEPIYEEAGAFPKLIGVHEIQARHASSPERRVELLHRIAELYEMALDDNRSAFQAHARALSEDPANTTTQAQLERLAEAMNGAEDLARVYEQQVQAVEEPQLACHLLVKAAQIREEQLGDHETAITHYKRVLELDDHHLDAATALERLYQLAERYEELASIYLTKSRMLPSVDEQKAYLFRGAAIYEEILERPNDAIVVYDQVLALDPEELQAIDKLVENYLGLENWPKLLDAYTKKADIVVDPEEKKRLYVEVGSVYERELGDVAKAIDTYQRILEIDPDEFSALGRLDALYGATQNWQELMSVLEREADLSSDPSEVISYRYRIADLWHHKLGDAGRAVEIYREILEVIPEHQPTLDALEAMIAASLEPVAAAGVLEPIYKSAGEWEKLIAVHEVQIAHEPDPVRKVELLHRVAELYETQLDQAPKAFQAFARALPYDNRDENTLGSLERLAEMTGAWGEVTRLYDVEIQRILRESPEDVIDMALRTAQIYEVQVGDVRSAIDRYKIVVEADEGHVQAIEALDRLFEASERWGELADILAKEVLVAASPDDILTLQFRAAQVYQQHLGDVDRAIEQYREILAAAPEHSPSLAALEQLFDDGVRPLAVGEILEPLYRMQEAYDRLLNVHEVQLNYQSDPVERVAMMHRISEIAEERAGDHEKAFVWMQRALLEDPAHDHTLAEVERLGSMLDGWPQLANSYSDSIERTSVPAAKVDLGRRLARVFEQELGDVQRAEEAYRFVLGVDVRDEESLVALDRIYVEQGSYEALADVLKKRIAASEGDGEGIQLNYRLGQVLDYELGRTEEAINVYKHVLGSLEPEHAESIRALQDIYTRLQDWPNLFGAYEKELAVVLGDQQQSEILAKMARLGARKLANPAGAVELWRKVLDLRGEDPEALNALGNLYAEQQNWRDLVDILEREVAVSQDDSLSVAIYADLGRIWYEKLERERNALESWERVFDFDPGNVEALHNIAEIYRAGNQYHELVDTLHRIIDVGAATLEDAAIEHVYMQLGHLYYAQLSQPVDAVESFAKVLEVNPRSFDAMAAMEVIHRSEGMWEDVIGVMERRVLAYDEPAEKVAQLFAIANMWTEEAESPDKATSAFKRVLELEPMHQYAFLRLEQLHKKALRWEELIEMYVARVEATQSTAEQVMLLGRIAKIHETKLDDKEQAFEALQLAWSIDFEHKPTVRELERVTALANKWNELLTSANTALGQVEDPATKIVLCLHCARWYGQELGHPEYAIPYYQQILNLDPTSVPAMQSMAELYRTTKQWQTLAQVLGRLVETTDDELIRADTYVQMGDLCTEQLGIPEQAPQYYEQALVIAPSFVPALDAVERICREQGDWPRVVEMLRRKAAALPDADAIRETKLLLADAYEVRTRDVAAAIKTYNEVLELDPVNMVALKGVERLYAQTEKWPELRKTLETQLDVVTSERERVTLLTRLAGMWEEEFLKPDKAAERLEQVVDIDSGNEEALNSLARLYRGMQRWDDLVNTFERHVSATPDRQVKIRIYKEMGDVFAKELSDLDRAIDSYLAVLGIDEDDMDAVTELARMYERREDYAAALDMMDKQVRLIDDPARQVELKHRMGVVLETHLGDRVAAMEHFQTATDLDPGHLPSLEAMRKILVDSGDWHAAAKALQQEAAHLENPRLVAERLVELGRIQVDHLDEPERGIETFEEAHQKDPDNEDAALPLVEHYMSTERYGDAFPLLAMLVKRSDKREPAEQHRLAFMLGEAGIKVRDYEEAIKALNRAYAIDGTHLPTLVSLAAAYYAAKDWDKAFKYYQMLLVQNRDDMDRDQTTDIFYRLGIIKREQGEPRKALNMFEKALEEDSHHRATLEALVDLYEKQAKWQEVISYKRLLLEVATDDSERFQILNDVGDIYQGKLKDIEKAIESFNDARMIKPDDHPVLHKLLACYQSTKRWAQAIEIIDQVADLDDRVKAKAKYAYTAAVITRDELKDEEGAIKRFNTALDHDPGELKAFEAINKVLTEKKDWKGLERAYRKMLHRIIGQEKTDLEFNLWHTLGIIYRDRQKNFDAAAEAFKMATKLQPDNATEHQILAELYATMPERVGEAIEEHQWLLRQDPYRVDSYKALYKLYFDARAYDKAWCLAATLSFLKKADAEQGQFYQQYRQQGLIRPQSRVDNERWVKDLFHPDEDLYVSKMMEMLAPALLAVKLQSDKVTGLAKLKPVDFQNTQVTFVKTFAFVHQVLNLQVQPRLFLRQDAPGGLMNIAGSQPPAIVAGSTLLQGYTPQDLTFIIGRHLAYFRGEHFVRTILTSHSELKMMLLSALRIAGISPADPTVDQWVSQLQPHLSAAQVDAIRGVAKRFVEAGGSTDIKRWMQSVELSAIRAGFLVCNDLETASRMIMQLPAEGTADLPPKEKIKELVLFSVSESYFRLREALGIQIQV